MSEHNNLDEQAAPENPSGLRALGGRLASLLGCLAFLTWVTWLMAADGWAGDSERASRSFLAHLAYVLAYDAVSILTWTLIVVIVAVLSRWALGMPFAKFLRS